MSYYLCGHDRKPIFLKKDNFKVAMTKWAVWKYTTGFEGDKSQCFKCYCKNVEPLEEEMINKVFYYDKISRQSISTCTVKKRIKAGLKETIGVAMTYVEYEKILKVKR